MADDKITIALEAILNDDRFKKSLKEITAETGKADKATKQLSQSNQSLGQSYQSLAGYALATIAAFAGLAKAVGSSIAAYTQSQAAMMRLSATAKAMNTDYGALQKAVDKLSKTGLISKAEASTAISNLVKFGMSVEDATTTLEGHIDMAISSRQAHYELGQAVVTFTEGVRNENSVLSDATGMTKNISVIYKEYAATLGVSTEALTKEQKAQAVLNASMQETAAYAGAAAKANETFAGASAKMRTAINELAIEFGRILAPALTNAVRIITALVDAFRRSPTIVKIMVIALGTMIPAIIAVTAATQAYAAIQTFVTALMGPAGAAQVAFALAVAGTTAAVIGVSLGMSEMKTQADGATESVVKLSKAMTSARDSLNYYTGVANDGIDVREMAKRLDQQIQIAETKYKTLYATLAEAAKKNNQSVADYIKQLDSGYSRDAQGSANLFSARRYANEIKDLRAAREGLKGELDQLNADEQAAENERNRIADEAKAARLASARDLNDALRAEGERRIAQLEREKNEEGKTILEQSNILAQIYDIRLAIIRRGAEQEIAEAKGNALKIRAIEATRLKDEEKLFADSNKEILALFDTRAKEIEAAIAEIEAMGGKVLDVNRDNLSALKEQVAVLKQHSAETAKSKEAMAKFVSGAQQALSVIRNLANSIGELGSSHYDAQIAGIEELIAANEDYYYNDEYGVISLIEKELDAIRAGTEEQMALREFARQADLQSLDVQIRKAEMMRNAELANELKRRKKEMLAEEEAARLEKQLQQELIAKEEEKAAKEEELRAQAQKAQYEQAVWERNLALVNVWIDAASAALGLLANPGGFAGIAAAAGAMVTAGVSTGIIMSKKIPQYLTGTEQTSEGLAMLHDGERVIPARLNAQFAGVSNDMLAQAAIAGLRLPAGNAGGSIVNNETQNYDYGTQTINLYGIRNAFDAQNEISRVAGRRYR